MGDLQELFSRLKAQSSDPAPAAQSQGSEPSIWAYQQPSVSSPIFSPPAHTPNPVHSSNIISPANPSSMAGTPAPDQARTNNLLNLLKFNNQSSQPSSQAGPMANLQNVGARSGSMHFPPTSQAGRPIVDPRPLSAQTSPMAAAGAEKNEIVTSSSNEKKDFLLDLFKPREPKSVATSTTSQTVSAKPLEQKEDEAAADTLPQHFTDNSFKPIDQAQLKRESTPVRQFGSPDVGKAPFEAPQPPKSSLFSYVNPFDQLHSSSPLNRSPKQEAQSDTKKYEILKHGRNVSSSNLNGEAAQPVAKSRKVASRGASPAPPTMPAQVEKSQSVSEALEGVGEKVNRQAEQALAEADAQEKDLSGGEAAPADTGDNTAEDETELKKESAIDDDDVESSWESAEDEEAEKDDSTDVKVYNFPMKPFVSIQIKDTGVPRPIRQDNFIVVAQLKKEFDQIDRALVTASQTHMVYAQGANKKDNGGFRVIRQDNGDHKQVFRSTGERVFSVQLCNTTLAGNDVETVLGTGVNGSVFWTSIAKSRGELFRDDDVESQGFIMPPVATPEEQTSGSPVKTRAKMSSRHPEFFGVARGKQIHIIAPETVKSKTYLDRKTRKVNSEKYFAEHGLKIITGKAGKDFCFSEDDTMIVSLDKSGRFKFWDIKDLISRAGDTSEGKHEPVELREPIWSLTAAASGSKPDEKPSVSSIMFLDKERPTVKGVALRYVLIGFKQNHILQLWDLGLGKAVQEIGLPHEKDSDGICSITYHPRSGIIALGHPTRNSIYFIHLSAPKYNISHMDQAKYINLLARGDSALPRPESTAIMSGLREFSFAGVGELRSLDMLRQPVENASDPENEDATLFELYLMHSKGVVGMSVKRKDLGWDKDSKMVKPIDAVGARFIDVKELILPQKTPQPSEQSSNTDVPAKATGKPTASKKQEPPKPAAAAASKPETVKKEAAPSLAPNGAARVESMAERASKQVPEAPTASQQQPANPPLMTPDSYAMAAQRAKSPTREKAVQDPTNTVKKVGSSPKATAVAPQVSSNDDIQVMLNKQFDVLYQRIYSDKRVVDAAAGARNDAVLRLVSSTLTENVDKSLNKIISANIERDIIPSLIDSTSKVVEKKLAESLPQHINNNVSREVKAALPGAMQQALKDPQVHRAITDQVAAKVQQQISSLLQQSMPSIASQATQKMMADLEQRTSHQLHEAESRRQQDNAKIQELSDLVRGLSETIQNMSASQAAFQQQVVEMQRGTAAREDARPAASADPQADAEDLEAKKITELLVDGQYNQATIQVRPSYVDCVPQFSIADSPCSGSSLPAKASSSTKSSSASTLATWRRSPHSLRFRSLQPSRHPSRRSSISVWSGCRPFWQISTRKIRRSWMWRPRSWTFYLTACRGRI